jgi:signal transduction histidine kinase
VRSPFHLLRRTGLSLRITATFAIGALAVSVAVALSAYLLSLRFQVNSEQDDALRQTYLNAAVVRARLLAPPFDVPAVLDTLTTGSDTNSVIYHDGRWFASSLVVSRDALPADLRLATLGGDVARAWTRNGDRPQLIVGVPLPATGGAYFQTFDETNLSHNLSVLRSILLGAVTATTVAGGLLGWRASRRLTSPLRAVATAARRLSEGNFQTKLPERYDRELTGLVDGFNSMVDTLHARLQRDAEFAGNVSHELRSPLTTLSTSLAVLESRRNEMPPRAVEALDLLAAEVTRFERLVDDLIEISRAQADSSKTEDEPIVIAELVFNFAAATGRDSLPIDVDPDAMTAVVLGDKRRLHQVMRNLVENADRHGGGARLVRVTADDLTVRVLVDDAGPGVAKADRERIFDRFARGRATSRGETQKGTGLGLALVREHVRAMGGNVSVTDAPLGGARFVVELPRSPR